MEYHGLKVCLETHSKIDKELQEKIVEVEDAVYANDCVKSSDKISGDDLIEILYDDEDPSRLGLFPPDWTDKGRASTNKESLNIMLEQIDDELERRLK